MGKVKFHLLSKDEIKELSNEEAYEYYSEIYGRLKKDSPNYENNRTKVANVLNRIIKKILMKFLPYDVNISGMENLMDLDYPVIFASTHQDFYDVINSIFTAPYNLKTLNSSKVNMTLKTLLRVNGVIFVDREDTQSKNMSKSEMINTLNNGQSINLYPEATFCLSPNRLHLPFHIGAIDVAQKTGRPIIPVVQEYTYKRNKKGEIVPDNVRIHFNKAFYVDKEKDRIEALHELEEVVETAQWQLFEQNGIHSRNEEDIKFYLDLLKKKRKDVLSTGASLESEKNSVYHSDAEFYQYYPVNSREDDYKETNFLNSTNKQRR